MTSVLAKVCGDGEAGAGGIFHPLALENEKSTEAIFHIFTQSGGRIVSHSRAAALFCTARNE